MPRAIAAPADQRRQQAIEALLALAWERAPSVIRTAEIAERMGVTQPALFRHFPTKEALWQAALEHITNSSWQRIEALNQSGPGGNGPSCTLVAALLRSHATLVSERPGVARLLLHELQNPNPSEARAVVERFLARFRALLVERLKPLPDPDLLANVLLAQLQGLVLQGLLAGDLTPLPRQLDAVLPLLLPGLAEGL
ncbi:MULTISPECIES: TetR/AcrR family transcriptional regulator [unclassified Cyanobium]|uniref:TetR/AcrR family transcriptional regulator n=1 Tax=unclassified Cyanobium TaxID=2627006 RepID=UPI0020CCC358|nr:MULTISPECIES: TetR/AcrR family transcriptional regulator [unclassified Cyanobium]MCP9832769.1 TetR/AcrR family transcriptional regulator [Cyanobium sp. La Preciosa 7G6]MCP9935520.1 TetR/AcrR family transcriptional regulator [Cyanobium sp. Aljojuca 7A6]